MPIPEALAVVVKVTHPCYVSVLRAKLHRSLDIPLEDIRYRKGEDITSQSCMSSLRRQPSMTWTKHLPVV